MKKHFPTGSAKYCRMFLKVGSGLFLLFFTLFAPAAPIIAQFGSMMFLLLIFCLSPFLPEKSHTAQVAAPENDQAYYWHIANDTAAAATVLQHPQKQSSGYSISPAITVVPGQTALAQHRSRPQNYTFFVEKPETWRMRCQPMRAGPSPFLS
ncbi:MAG: hypothetical protein IKA65_04625 [Lentisphaeria bacterium]|nr:hypothetical protein [Lentisphaeria bacterium]